MSSRPNRAAHGGHGDHGSVSPGGEKQIVQTKELLKPTEMMFFFQETSHVLLQGERLMAYFLAESGIELSY